MSAAIKAMPDPDGRVARWVLSALAVLLIVVNIVLAFAYLQEFRDATAWANRSLRVMRVLKEIEDFTERSGQDQRLYRLYGDAQRLDSCRRALSEIPPRLARLRELIDYDGDQRNRLGGLTRQLEQDRAALETALTPVAARFGDGQVPPELAAGVERTDAINAAVDVMLASEQTLLRDRLAEIESNDTVKLTAGMVIRTGAIVLVVAVIFSIYRKSRGNATLARTRFAALQESDQRFRRAFDESPLGMVLARSDGQRIVQANPAFCRMLRYDSDELAGRSIAEFAHVDDRHLLDDATGDAGGPEHAIELRCLTRAGVIAWTRVRLSRLSVSEDDQALLLVLAENITHEKQVEAELRQAQKMEAIGQLTGGIAHDFNNLLGVIIGNVEFLIDAVRDRPAEGELASEILHSALSGADLTRRLLAVARRQTLQPQRIDLNGYLPNHVAILRRVLGEGIQIIPDFAADLWPIRADPSQVGDALLNLAINARDAMPRGGRLTIATANVHVAAGTTAEDVGMAAGDYILLAVSDTGVGMAPALLDRAMEPFFTTKEPGSGSGLGLSMIYGFARQSGGHMRIESRLGHGTTVRLYLPRAVGEDAGDGEAANEPPAPCGDESILLVDDNPELRAVGRRHLVALGYRVTEAADGPAALALLQGKDRYDLLFTDIAMPNGMTGYQLAASARLLQPGLRVLFTTGYDDPETAAGPARPAPGAMIAKPYRKGDLAVAMRSVLEA
jgi:PAS domain S-box-containing protein